ncbi:MAG TPA: thioredoxin domain-containing protein [Sphingomicrobium sp.]
MKPSRFLVCMTAAAALAACDSKQQNAASNEPLNIAPVAPPQGGDWTSVVAATPEGGYLMGNPNAKVKLVEIGSLSCPHCKAFDDEGVPTLVDKFVKSGNVSWEFRPYIIHGAIDMAANLVVRCNGEKTFFPLMQALYKDQADWMAKVEAAPQDKMTQIQSMPPNQAFVAMASLIGLQDWAAARGVPAAKTNQCLSDQKMIDREVQVVSDVTDQYPDFTGTPAFIINGKLLPREVVNWDTLEPKLREALR